MKINFQRKKGYRFTLDLAYEEDVDAFQKLEYDQNYIAVIKKISLNNLRLHKKYFSLLQLGFDYWQPVINDIEVQKDFEHFREWVIIQAGFFKTVINVDVSVQNVAESIAFPNMTDEKKARLLRNTITVLSETVLEGLPENEKENLFNEILSYV